MFFLPFLGTCAVLAVLLLISWRIAVFGRQSGGHRPDAREKLPLRLGAGADPLEGGATVRVGAAVPLKRAGA